MKIGKFIEKKNNRFVKGKKKKSVGV